ncbi:hypothetical protein SAMN06297358_0837 [Pedobacter xixiisoli]|uniref:Uncharacterized protein n=1 Tax=Pedobacter xixiisoli TaxID=1476464 RepID=A0A285ZT12_9SPHI|nr:hypothetical protein SAMN06297358_0837 [Pedobacter xixiisoli]
MNEFLNMDETIGMPRFSIFNEITLVRAGDVYSLAFGLYSFNK